MGWMQSVGAGADVSCHQDMLEGPHHSRGHIHAWRAADDVHHFQSKAPCRPCIADAQLAARIHKRGFISGRLNSLQRVRQMYSCLLSEASVNVVGLMMNHVRML